MPNYIDAATARAFRSTASGFLVADGGFAKIGVDYVQLGKQVAAMVLKVAGGTAPSECPMKPSASMPST
jgi:putative ABC transport system substrate-binding protein